MDAGGLRDSRVSPHMSAPPVPAGRLELDASVGHEVRSRPGR